MPNKKPQPRLSPPGQRRVVATGFDPLRGLLPVVFVAAITCVAYANSFGGIFVHDDIHEIQLNPLMQWLVPPWEAMFVGKKLPARPLPYLTFAIDHAVWGGNPFGYHVTNLAIHVAAAIALYSITRLTLLSPRLCDRWGGRDGDPSSRHRDPLPQPALPLA